MRVVALHQIERRVNGEPEVVKPGTLFNMSGDDLKSMLASGAVCKPEDPRAGKFGFATPGGALQAGSIQVAPGPAEATKTISDVVDSEPSSDAAEEDEDPAEDIDVDDMSVKKVKAFMEANGIEEPEGWSDKRADDKRAWLKEFLADDDAEDVI